MNTRGRKFRKGVITVTIVLSYGTIWSAAECAPQTKGAVVALGRVEGAGNTISIGTAATGTVAELLVHEGSRVAAGQLLVRIECASVQKEVDARNAGLAATEAALERVVRGPRPEELNMALAAADSAEARAKEAEVYVQRLASSKGLTVSEAQLDHAQRDAKVAAAQFAEARAKLALLQAGSRREDVQEAQSTRDAARAWLAEAAARLDYCSVRAPSVGVILDTHVTRGQLVSAAAPMVLLTLVDDSRRRVRAEVHERDVAGVCPKQHAVVTSEAFPGTQLEAATEWISEGMRQPAMSTANEQKGDVREVLLSLGAGGINWPIGLRVSVKFGNCPETQ